MIRTFHFSIRTTLLIIISILNILIMIPFSFSTYKAWINYQQSQELRKVSRIVSLFYTGEKFLSLERGASMAVLYTSSKTHQSLKQEMYENREKADRLFEKGLLVLPGENPSLNPFIKKVRQSRLDLEKIRDDLDANLALPMQKRDYELSGRFFYASTVLMTNISNLIESYSRPYLIVNATAARQMRFIDLIWDVTEYAGREYAVLGELVAGNKYPTPENLEKLALWRARIQYGWELAHSAVANNTWGAQVAPYMAEAETHYFITFEQIKDIFDVPAGRQARNIYPVSVEMWLELASQAVDSLHGMSDKVLSVSQAHLDAVEEQAEREIVANIILLATVIILSFSSWRLVTARVINPINSLVEALYKATRGESYVLPPIKYSHDEIGKLGSVLMVFQENSRQLEEERDKAQAANVAKTEFLANMSHEIRTPMNVVLGLSNILAKSSPLTAKQEKYISTLKVSAESLLTLINDLLDFSRIETQNFELEHIDFNLTELIDEVVDLMSLKAQEKGLIFHTNCDDISGKIFIGDPGRIRQILINLCGNAVKFTEKGKIILKVECPANPGGQRTNLYISVIDTGIGIALEKIDLIFEKFTQADATISRKYGGTGLGLAITKNLVEKMHGQISVESVYQEGTTFRVYLPLAVKLSGRDAVPDAQAAPDLKNEGQGNARKTHILLVEDYRPNALVAETYLDELGVQYDTAENGYQALELIQQKEYDAVLMDIQMPGLDGYQTTKAIRKYEKNKNQKAVKIIGITAHAMKGVKEKCLAAGMDDYLSKPFKSEELREKLSVVSPA